MRLPFAPVLAGALLSGRAVLAQPAPEPPSSPAHTSTASDTPVPSKPEEPPAAPPNGVVEPPAPPVAPPPPPPPPPVVAPAAPAEPPLTWITPGGAIQQDYYRYFGPGVSPYRRTDGTGLDGGFVLPRVQLDVRGRINRRWMFIIQLEAGRTSNDAFQRPVFTVAPGDAWLGYEASPMFRVTAGQTRTPSSLDNVIPIRWHDFVEKTVATRAEGGRDMGLMVSGESPRLLYAGGYFNGSGGGQNRRPLKGSGDIMGRFAVRPLVGGGTWSSPGVHVGVSGRYGERDPRSVIYDAPAYGTGGGAANGFVFWTPVRFDTDFRELHIIPSSIQAAASAELMVNWGRIDLVAEGTVRHFERREAASNARDFTLRSGLLTGPSYYVMVAAWLWGTPRSNYSFTRASVVSIPEKMAVPTAYVNDSLEAAFRVEQLFLDYDSDVRSRDGAGNPFPGVTPGPADRTTTKIRADVYQLALNYWVGRYIRLTAQGSLYHIPVDNQAKAPGALNLGDASWGTAPPTLPAGVPLKPEDLVPRVPDATTLVEVVARVQLVY